MPIERYCIKKNCPGGDGCINEWKSQGHSCVHEYVASSLPEHLRWKGAQPTPSSWWVGTTKVYRTYAADLLRR